MRDVLQLHKKMLPFKKEIESILQEKARLIDAYKNDMDLALGQIKQLEHDNVMMRRDCDALQATVCNGGGGCPKCGYQLDACQKSPSQQDGRLPTRQCLDVTERVMLERIRVLEAGRMMLELEKENQQLQYERCLDEIARHVVDAIVAQKNLKEECIRLRKRVIYLECQNQELVHLLTKRYQFSSAPTLQDEGLFDARRTLLPLTYGLSLRSFSQTRSFLMSQDSEARRIFNEPDLDQGRDQSSHLGTSGRNRDFVVGHSLDAQIHQVLLLTRELSVVADVRSGDVGTDVDDVAMRDVVCQLEEHVARGKELFDHRVSSVLQVQSLLSDDASTDSEETGSWDDVQSIGCCCASLSELLDGPTEVGEGDGDGDGLTEDEDVIASPTEIVNGSIEPGGSNTRQLRPSVSGENSVTDVNCCAFHGEKTSYRTGCCNDVETMINGAEMVSNEVEMVSNGACLLNEYSSSFADSKCCVKTLHSSVTDSSISTIQNPLQLKRQTMAASCGILGSAAPAKSSTNQTSESRVKETFNRFSTSFGSYSPTVNQPNDLPINQVVNTRTTFPGSKTTPGNRRCGVHLRNSAPMNDGGSAPSSLTSFQKTSKDINNMMEQTYRMQNPYRRRVVNHSNSLRLPSNSFEVDRERHRVSWPTGSYGRKLDCVPTRQFEDPEVRSGRFYSCGTEERSASMPWSRTTTVSEEKPMRPLSDSCIGYSMHDASQSSLSQFDSCNHSGEVIWMTPATNSDNFPNGRVSCTSERDSSLITTASGTTLLQQPVWIKDAQSTFAVANAASDLAESRRAERLQRMEADQDVTCFADVTDVSSFKPSPTYQADSLILPHSQTQHTSGDKIWLTHSQQNSTDSRQDLTTIVKPSPDNSSTGNDAPSLFLTKTSTERLNLEAKGHCETTREECSGAEGNLDTARGTSLDSNSAIDLEGPYGNMMECSGAEGNLDMSRGASLDSNSASSLAGKGRTLSTAHESVTASPQFGNVDPTIPVVVDDAEGSVLSVSEDVGRSCDPEREFEEISAQMRSLTETVKNLERALTTANSGDQTNETNLINEISSSLLLFDPTHKEHSPPTTFATAVDVATAGTPAGPLQGTTSTPGDGAVHGCCGSVAETGNDAQDVGQRCLVALNYSQLNEEQLVFERVDEIPSDDVIPLPNGDASFLPLVTSDVADVFDEDDAAAEEDFPPTATSSSSFKQQQHQHLMPPWSIYDQSSSGEDDDSNEDEQTTRSHGDGFARHFRSQRCRHHLARTANHNRRPMMGSKRLLTHARPTSYSQNALQCDHSTGRHLGDDVSSDEYDAGDTYRRQTKSSSDGGLAKTSHSSDRVWFDGGQTRGSEEPFVLSGPLQHRSVLALKQECQLGDAGYRGRQSVGPEGGGRETGQLGRRPKPTVGGGSSYWSLSDSCFETFSGSSPKVNDTTVL